MQIELGQKPMAGGEVDSMTQDMFGLRHPQGWLLIP